MTAAPPVTAEEADGFLRKQLGDVVHVEYVGAGHWSRCYGFTHAGRDLVVRFGNQVEDFERDRIAGRYTSPALPVPEVLDVVETDAWWAAISTRAVGAPLESLSLEEWQRTLPAVFSLLDAARSVDLSATVGYGEWGADGAGRHPSWPDALLAVSNEAPVDRTPGWRRAIAALPAVDAVFLAGIEGLRDLADAGPADRHLIHDDLLNRNVLVDAGRITGVFDWGCSMYGDHLYDLGHLLFWAPWYPAMDALDIGAAALSHFDTIGLAVADLDARLTACQLRVGLNNLGYSAAIGDPSVTWIADRITQVLESAG